MPQQLIYTSAPRGLVAGRSGYCTVARSAGMREALMLRLEQLSYYHHLSLAGGQERPISAYRVVDIRGSRFHVLSRIRDAGLDFTGRTNFIAHHLVLAPEEIRRVPTPAVILRDWSGWLAGWKMEPQALENEDWGHLSSLAGVLSLPARTWQRLTGDAVNGYGLLELKPGACLGTDGVSEKEALSLLAEATELLEVKDARRNFQAAAWQYTFTTSLQEQDNPGDFRWRLAQTDTPAWAKIAGTSGVPLSGVRASGVSAEERAFAEKGWQAPATVTLTPDRSTITEGESVRLEAKADGIPYPRYKWFVVEQGQPVEMAGCSGPVLEEQPEGRARRYIVRAENRVGCKDSRVVELTIRQPLRLASREPMLVVPKAGRAGASYIRTEEEMDEECLRWKERKAQKFVPRKGGIRYVVLTASFLAIACAVVLIFPRVQERGKRSSVARQASRASTNPPPGEGVTSLSPPSPAGNAPATDASMPAASGQALHNPGQTNPSAVSKQRPAASGGSSEGGGSNVITPAGMARTSSDPDQPWPRDWKVTLVGDLDPGICRSNYSHGTFLLTGAGKNNGEREDNFYFVHQIVSNSVTLTARVRLREPERESAYTLCGIMIRESEQRDAPFVLLGLSKTHLETMTRERSGQPCRFHRIASRPGNTDEFVLEFRHSGNTVTMEAQGNKAPRKWCVTNDISISEGRYLVGFALCSGYPNKTIRADFDDVYVNGVKQ